MLKSSLFILFCKTDADFHQMATFILWLDVYSRHTVSFLDLTYSCRTLLYDTFDMTLLHLILVTAPKCGYSSSVGMYRNIWSSCFHTFINRLLCFLSNIMKAWGSDTHCLGPLVPWHGAMTFGISGHWIIWNCLNMYFFKKSGSRFKNKPLLSSYWFISTK